MNTNQKNEAVLLEKPYSKEVLGYFVTISGNPYYIINDIHDITKKGQVYFKLKSLAREFDEQDVFILIHNDFQVHIKSGGHYENSIIERNVI